MLLLSDKEKLIFKAFLPHFFIARGTKTTDEAR